MRKLSLFILSGLFLIMFATGCDSGKGDNNIFYMLLFGSSKQTVATPTYTPTEGTYDNNINVAINCSTTGAGIYYTADGTEPTISSTPYVAPIPVIGDGSVSLIKAIAVKSGMTNSNVASSTFTINYRRVSTPQFTPAEGTLKNDVTVTLSSMTTGAAIYYTIDGTTPTTSSDRFQNPIAISGNGKKMNIKALAVKSGMRDSTIASANYSIQYDPAAIPVFTPGSGVYSVDTYVSISCETPGAIIYYTTDGSEPTTSLVPYAGGSISITGHDAHKILKAIAVKPGMLQSPIASAEYTINYDRVSTPQFDPAGDISTYHDFDAKITCSTSGAVIYYTTNGSEPTTESTPYTGPIAVKGPVTTTTIRAIAVKNGMLNSTEAVQTYTIQYRQLAAPGFLPLVNTIFKSTPVYIGFPFLSEAVYYTDDGSTPTRSSNPFYEDSYINVSKYNNSVTFKAIAVGTGMLDSEVRERTYILEQRKVYITGFYNGEACYWLNGEKKNIPESNVQSITRTLVSGSDIYMTGQSYNGNWVACYWKNNVRTDLYTESSEKTKATGIAVVGGDVYVAGTLTVGSNNYGCYWVNGTRYDLPETSSTTGGIAVSGSNVYVVGSYIDAASRRIACYWVNGTRYDLHTTSASDSASIAISGSDIYIGGTYFQTENSITIPCYWKNGEKIDLESKTKRPDMTGSSVTEIAVSGSDVYVSGSFTLFFSKRYYYFACYWKNGVSIVLDDAFAQYATFASAVGIAVSGSDVYVVCRFEDFIVDYAHTEHIIKLFKNGQELMYLSDYKNFTTIPVPVSLYVTD